MVKRGFQGGSPFFSLCNLDAFVLNFDASFIVSLIICSSVWFSWRICGEFTCFEAGMG